MKHELEGRVFDRLTAVKEHGRDKDGYVLWLCTCSCGNTHLAKSSNLIRQQVKSCGCLRRESPVLVHKKHNYRWTREYRIWTGMRSRCNDKHNIVYHRYGGRGIKVCERWNDVTLFIKDVGLAPSSKHQLDRIDNAKSYEPGNVRWTTSKINNRNRRDNFLVTYKGETKPLAAWAEQVGIGWETLKQRIKQGWTVEDVFTVRPGTRKQTSKQRFV